MNPWYVYPKRGYNGFYILFLTSKNPIIEQNIFLNPSIITDYF